MGFSEWRKTTLGSVLSLYNGARRPEEKGEIPVYGGNGILAYSNDFNTDGENIIIGRVGAYCGNVNYVNGRCWVSDNAILAKVVSGNNSKYMYYRLVYQDLHNLRIGSSQPLLTQSIIKKTEIKLPPLEEQKAIANILSTLDEKIEVNNQINKILEEMAQAIFKHWFVDFEFPNEKGEPYKSSGGEMVESELGMIPKGWYIGQLGDIAKISSGKRPLNKSKEMNSDYLIPLIGASSIMGYVKDYNYNEPVIVIGRVGTHGVIQRFNKKIWASDNTLVIRPKYYEYVYQLLRSIDYNSLNRGSTQPLITQTDVNVRIIMPCKYS